ncbi:hypothetical protein HDV06_005641 [Boothiomyces sp. JEL0866]|nr:hypothetical protein HDV06_005641 [Boothiomyces sp. JEL0866]
MATRQERQGDKALNEKHTKILKELMARPENKKCADCGKKDPRWASWNLGIFFCINCSGVHRSIGTHITKVKSADLDTWTPEQVENMIRWGNAKANSYWEHDLPKGFQKGSGNVDSFIRDKYERKKYAMRGDLPDPSTINIAGGEQSLNIAAQPKQPAVQAQQQQDATQQLFSAFQNAAPAPTTAKSTATEQLFEAFQSAPTTQPPKNSKDSILSLYSNPPPNHSAAQQSAAFGAFQSQNTFSTSNNFATPNQPHQNLAINSLNGFSLPSNPSSATPHSTQQSAPLEFGAFNNFQSQPVAKAPPKDPFADFGNFGASSPSSGKPKDDWSAFE